ncbi:TonB-dependent receptor domain-containing protein [Microbulbifer sp. 2205BS26-8]|uniref:TonB-dependent receptor domain-containing protein n=1 Tax=Microbulbifer sp. 2205BS26-8 TaxID=3064386 RepID=UPI00273FD8BF|nr:TonB-dependent receptor [Microbulbifer sp. 2205BS26-8]MDP5209567.1 TonB-dependent receptor [Microbulbifer sp. 2205BS26-8]
MTASDYRLSWQKTINPTIKRGLTMKKNLLSVAVKGALGFSAAAIMVPAMPAFAQQDAEMVEEIVVTGSRIQRDANEVSVSPVTSVNAEDFKATGVVRVEDLINDLPQVAATQTAGQANGATGTATVDLRDLGSERTLVLIDGRRMPAGSPISGGSSADLNQIPGALVERVEVLTGGASAAYGSDAIAGVVNFVMMDDFEGVRFETQTSVYQHNNDNSRMQNLVTSSGYDVADGNQTDGKINDFSMIMGANLDDGRGNVTAYANYRKIDAVLQSDRDYSGCALGISIPDPDTVTGIPTSDDLRDECGGSGTLPSGRFTLFDGVNDYTVSGNEFVPWDEQLYNYGPLNYFQRPDERWTMGVFGHYDISENVTAYTQLSYADDRTVAQIAPSGNFYETSSINCDNPLLSDQQRDLICTSAGLGPEDDAPYFIGRRNVEGGPRQDDLRHTTFRGVFGLRGDINETWSYDAYAQYAEVSMEETYLNDMSNTNIRRALDVVTDPDTGDAVCQSVLDGTDPNCVPWNIFQEGGVTQEALDYLILPLFARGTTEQEIYSAYATGNLGDYGVKLPTADSGVAVVIGAETRREALTFNPDSGFQSGDGAGQGGSTLPVSGSLSVKEFFTEANIPVLSGLPGAEYAGLEIAYRYSDYDTGVTTDTYKFGLDWQPISDVRVRASFQSAVRHANIRELFTGQGLALFDMNVDPCGGPSPKVTLEQCARTGVTADQYGNIPNSPANQYNYRQGGNPDLAPEESETISAGIVFTPSFIDGLNVSLDYFNIDVTDAIAFVDPQTLLNQCLSTGDPTLCGKINRDSNGSLWLPDSYIESINTNIGFFETAGFDINASYGFDLASMGFVNLNYIATYLTKWDQQEIPGAEVEDCVGQWGGSCGTPTPEFVSTLRATWATPVGVDVTAAWRHFSDVNDTNTVGVEDANGVIHTVDVNQDFDAINYLDLSASWAATESVVIRGGINNITGEEPPLTANAGAGIFGNGNTFAGIYDALGRYAFLGLTVDF